MTILTEALARIRTAQPRYRRYREYYDGIQPLAFATDKFRTAFGSMFQAFAYNLCSVVIDTIADRLSVEGFGVEQGGDEIGATAWELWGSNRMDTLSGEVHREALRCGDAYVTVWPDAAGLPTIWPQPASQMTVRYDEEQPGVILWAAKCWRQAEDYVRLNIYEPDVIRKFISRQKGAMVPEKEGSLELYGDQPELPNPWGLVPVFHFANDSSVGIVGRSELAGILALQDGLNKALCDMLVAMEFVAYPQRYATGLETERGEDGKPKALFIPGTDRVWAVGAPDVRFGEFAPANLQQILSVINDFEQKICRVSGIPPHYMALITDPPSGEALKTLETRFVKKCRARQAVFGNAWEDAMRLALRMAGQTTGARLSCRWADPAPETAKGRAETIRLKTDIGVSRRQALLELGYGEQDVDRMTAESQAERALAIPALGAPFGEVR